MATANQATSDSVTILGHDDGEEGLERFGHNSEALASTFHYLAIRAAERAKQDAKVSGQFAGYSLHAAEAVMLAVTAAEAGINEITDGGPIVPPHGFLDLKLRTKWSMYPMLATQTNFGHGASPWQDFDHLVNLRNALVHYEWGKQPPKWIEFFNSKKMSLQPPLAWVNALLTVKATCGCGAGSSSRR